MLLGRYLVRSATRLPRSPSHSLNPRWRTISAQFEKSFCDSKEVKPYDESIRNLPKYKLKPIDKFFIVVTGTMKRGEIPNEVSYEILETSQSRRRIIVNLSTMALTLMGCLFIIQQGKKSRELKFKEIELKNKEK